MRTFLDVSQRFSSSQFLRPDFRNPSGQKSHHTTACVRWGSFANHTICDFPSASDDSHPIQLSVYCRRYPEAWCSPGYLVCVYCLSVTSGDKRVNRTILQITYMEGLMGVLAVAYVVRTWRRVSRPVSRPSIDLDVCTVEIEAADQATFSLKSEMSNYFSRPRYYGWLMDGGRFKSMNV